MEIKELNIQNYKSIKDLSIINPSPFTVFVGPNAAGKSNIFDALEFYTTLSKSASEDMIRLFGDINNYNVSKSGDFSDHFFEITFENLSSYVELSISDTFNNSRSESFYNENFNKNSLNGSIVSEPSAIQYRNYLKNKSYIQCFSFFSRIFVGNEKIQKFAFNDDKKLALSCSNIEQVIRRVLKDRDKREEITEWLRLLIPGFDNIEIKTEELSGSHNLLIYERGIKKPLTKKIISDGTYNIIAILTALYQSDEPQFLCIEEPENGLNPKVVRELVTIFRQQCEEKGHFIWLNTHSQSIVSELTSEEIILVDKLNGETKIKQIRGMDLHGLKMDEALLTNAIGGGIPW